MEGMTIKQIARLCGKTEKTIRRWIELVRGQNVPENKREKTFSLKETILIIRVGEYSEYWRVNGLIR